VRVAKTMPDQPHWYVTRYKASDILEWERLVLTIRRIGFRGRYRSSYNTYLRWETDGQTFLYWTMGFPLPVTKLINRALDAGQVSPVRRTP
jgi:hypothetical protein